MGDTPDLDTDQGDELRAWIPPIGLRSRIDTADAWFDTRHALYEELRQYEIPAEIVDFVQVGHPETPIEWVDSKEKPVRFGQHTSYKIHPTPKALTDWYLESIVERWKTTRSTDDPSTVGEVLASLLREKLREQRRKRNAQKKEPGTKPARRPAKVIPQPIIARVASDLLEDCRFTARAPGPQLTALLQELLQTDQPALWYDRMYEARDHAAWILAHDSSLSARAVAARVGARHSSVLRWLKEEAFRKRIEDRRTLIKNCEEKSGRPWPGKS